MIAVIRVTEVASDWQFSLGFPIVVVFVFAIVAIAREIYLPQGFCTLSDICSRLRTRCALDESGVYWGVRWDVGPIPRDA